MRHAVLIPLTALALTACGDNEVSLTNASPEEVAKKVDAAGGTRFKPGKWEMTIQTVSVDIPGLDGEMKKQMTEMMLKKVQTSTSCITKKQAESPPAEVIARSQGRCKYENFQMDGGKIDGTLVCPAQGMGGAMKMRVAGTFDDESFAIDNDMEATSPNGPAMKIKAKSSGKRIGDCTAEEEKKADAAVKA
ncbi:DUF3617 domain-containing protein [Sphingomonas sp. MG17]|uniref:DUF3617 domain-containing protein n=1 Tax=Sphingomonas tagetis TaxID=2949092 RepID=A0A9X2HMW5_9SPHN|nr:DUF3617 domain-containing protein [Sphingomonas tagetis]MCP3730639.1 DUF3617 domain-containing protein [Sphingomonas tagetis]